MRSVFVFLIVGIFASTAFAQNDTLIQDEIIYTTDEFFCDEGLQPEFPGGIEDCPEFDAAIKTLLYEMPAWIPGRWKGEPVNTYFNLPVHLRFSP